VTERSSPARRFDDREVALIIKRASELQEQESPAESRPLGMTLAELEQVAREAGLDPALVRRAAVDVDARVTSQPASRFIGAPTTVRLERTLEGEVPVDEYESLVFEIQREMGMVGVASNLGRSLQWTTSSSGRPHASVRPIQVVVSPRNGRTTIRIEEPLGPIAGGLFGGLMGGLGGGLGIPLMAASLAGWHSAGAALAILAGAVGGSYLLARTIFGAVASRRAARLGALMERLTERVAASAAASAASSASAPPSPGEPRELGGGG
jgi:hypothetical protein